MAYIQPANLLWLKGGAPSTVCRPGQSITLTTPYAALDCRNSSVSGTGDTLSVDWHVLPMECPADGCGWNYVFEFVIDSGGLSDSGLAGWWRLDPARGPARSVRPGVIPTEADLARLREEIKVWQTQVGKR